MEIRMWQKSMPDRGLCLGPANDNLIDTTIELWRRRFRRDLSREDARQIVENVTGFFGILTEWAGPSAPANDNAEPDNVRRGPP
jgi:hypothetical protein